MDEGSVGALVPAVKGETKRLSDSATPSESGGGVMAAEVADELDKDLLCPICMQIIKDAFLTACGHSFCYMCIITHLQNKKDCPCCGNYLTNNQLYPNFLLDKLIVIRFLCTTFVAIEEDLCTPNIKTASPVEQFRQALQQGCEVSVKELDALLKLLAEKKRKMEQEEAERNMQILQEFLQCLRKQKVDELNEIQTDLQFIKEDISAVERHRIELYRARDRYSVNLRMLPDNSMATKTWPSPVAKNNSGLISSSRNVQGGFSMGNFPYRRVDGRAQASTFAAQRLDNLSGIGSEHISGMASEPMSQSGLAIARKKRVHTQFNDLQECYLQKRRQLANCLQRQEERDNNVIHREGYTAGLNEFQSILSTFTRYSRLRVIAELRNGDLFHAANIVSSIEFDCDDELFATAGVSRRIKFLTLLQL